MKKTNASFKMSKSTKRILVNEMNPHRYGDIKRAFIEAEVMSKIAPPREKGKKTAEENTDS
jgi:hypothetical protein